MFTFIVRLSLKTDSIRNKHKLIKEKVWFIDFFLRFVKIQCNTSSSILTRTVNIVKNSQNITFIKLVLNFIF